MSRIGMKNASAMQAMTTVQRTQEQPKHLTLVVMARMAHIAAVNHNDSSQLVRLNRAAFASIRWRRERDTPNDVQLWTVKNMRALLCDVGIDWPRKRASREPASKVSDDVQSVGSEIVGKYDAILQELNNYTGERNVGANEAFAEKSSETVALANYLDQHLLSVVLMYDCIILNELDDVGTAWSRLLQCIATAVLTPEFYGLTLLSDDHIDRLLAPGNALWTEHDEEATRNTGEERLYIILNVQARLVIEPGGRGVIGRLQRAMSSFSTAGHVSLKLDNDILHYCYVEFADLDDSDAAFDMETNRVLAKACSFMNDKRIGYIQRKLFTSRNVGALVELDQPRLELDEPGVLNVGNKIAQFAAVTYSNNTHNCQDFARLVIKERLPSHSLLNHRCYTAMVTAFCQKPPHYVLFTDTGRCKFAKYARGRLNRDSLDRGAFDDHVKRFKEFDSACKKHFENAPQDPISFLLAKAQIRGEQKNIEGAMSRLNKYVYVPASSVDSAFTGDSFATRVPTSQAGRVVLSHTTVDKKWALFTDMQKHDKLSLLWCLEFAGELEGDTSTSDGDILLRDTRMDQVLAAITKLRRR